MRVKPAICMVVWFLAPLGCEDEIDIPAAQPAAGLITVLDTGGPKGRTGWWPSVVFDHHDQPHISFCDAYHADLRYATRTDSGWLVRSVVSRGKIGKYTTIDIDRAGHPGIAFYDQDQKYLRYAWQDSADQWHTERVAWGLEVGMGGELRFDEQDMPHLFYYIPSGKLIHAQRSPDGEWHKEAIAEVTGGFSVRISPVLQPDGFWVSFVDWNFKDTTLLLAHQTDDGFDVQKVSDRRGPGWRSQLFFQNDKPWILFSQSFREELRIARRGEQDWTFTRLLRRVGNFAAAPAPNGDSIVAYEDVTNGRAGDGTLKYLRGRDEQWGRFSIDGEGPTGSHLAVAIDSKGKPLVAYYSTAIRGIKVYDETDGATNQVQLDPVPSDAPPASAE